MEATPGGFQLKAGLGLPTELSTDLVRPPSETTEQRSCPLLQGHSALELTDPSHRCAFGDRVPLGHAFCEERGGPGAEGAVQGLGAQPGDLEQSYIRNCML